MAANPSARDDEQAGPSQKIRARPRPPTTPVRWVISKAAETAAKAAAESRLPSVKPTEKAAKTSEAVPKRTPQYPWRPKRQKAANAVESLDGDEREGDALADAMAQAEKGEVSIDKARSTTHVDKSTGGAQRGEASPDGKVVIKDAAPKQVQSAAPVSRADSGDTVRRVPDEALIAKTRDAAVRRPRLLRRQWPKPKPRPKRRRLRPQQRPQRRPRSQQSPSPGESGCEATPLRPRARKKPNQRLSAKARAGPDAGAQLGILRRGPGWTWRATMIPADAIAAAKAELGPSFAAEAAKPIKAKPVEPLPKNIVQAAGADGF